MRLAKLQSNALLGVDAPDVTVEVHIANGLPALTIVGLPETTVRESKDRVRAAIINSRFEFPMRRITVNLAPAELPKSGGRFDLPIALGILAASGQIDHALLHNCVFIGELALSGELRPVRGCLPTALAARDSGRRLVCPLENANEAAIIEGIDCSAAGDLLSVCEQHYTAVDNDRGHATGSVLPDMRDVRGQHRARRALEIAAAGRHNLLMVGPPGTGKSMLASRMPGIMPPLAETEALETAAVYSVHRDSGCDWLQDWRRRPFRAPHHTASGVALVGGGSTPAPGEISLAHNGVLFLDELTEFERRVLDVLREPMETGHINISRAARQARFPARFQLIAAMNPCPQGYSCDGRELCRCTPEQQRRYRSRISAPLLDRIDMHIEVPRVPLSELSRDESGAECSTDIRRRVAAAHQRQLERSACYNASLGNADIEQHCALDAVSRSLLDKAAERLNLSARAYHRLLKLARTIADLDLSEHISREHTAEALSYRSLDRFSQSG